MKSYIESSKNQSKNTVTKPLKLSCYFTNKEEISALDIVFWWEKKRISFNLYLIFLGFICYHINHMIAPSIKNPLFIKENIYLMVLIFNVGYSVSVFVNILKTKSIDYGKTLFQNNVVIATLLIILTSSFFHFI